MKAAKEKINLAILLVTLSLFLLVHYLPFPDTLTYEAQIMSTIVIMAVVFWVTECIPIALTGLLIIFMQAIFNIKPLSEGLNYVSHPIFTLVFAGFVIAAAISKYEIDKRISLQIILFMGERTDRLILGMMIATAFLSMWVSNTAATVIMLPIAIGIIKLARVNSGSNFSKAMVIGVAFAANVGGMGTPVGTPACTITIAFLEDMANIHISFLEWSMRAVPIVIVLIPITWKLISSIIFPLEIPKIQGGTNMVKQQLYEMGELTGTEKRVMALFTLAVLLWILDTFLPLIEEWMYVASMINGFIFLIPVIGVITWKEAMQEIRWGLFFLIGGGLALGSGLKETGVIQIITEAMAFLFEGLGIYLIVILITLISGLSITFFCSFSVTATALVPIAIGLAFQLGIDPALLGISAGLGSCLAFLLPANAAPNAIAYSHGYFKTMEMTKAGVPQMLISIVVVTLFNVLWAAIL